MIIKSPKLLFVKNNIYLRKSTQHIVMNKFMTVLKFIWTVSVIGISLVSCSNGRDTLTDFEKVADMLCGEYSLTDIYWTGAIVDLDQDGIGRRDLKEELKNIPGYVESWGKADVSKRGDDDKLLFKIVVPDYVTLEKEGKYVLSSVRYQGIDIEGQWRGGVENPKLSTETFELATETSMDGTYIVHSMKKADIYDFGDGSFVCRSECFLLDKSQARLVEGTILYSFSRR